MGVWVCYSWRSQSLCVWVCVCTYGCVGVCMYLWVWVCYSWRSQSLCPHYCTLGTPSSLSSLSGSSPAPSVSLPPTGSSARSTAPSRLTNVEVRVPLICSAASDCQVPLPCRASAGEQASVPSGWRLCHEGCHAGQCWLCCRKVLLTDQVRVSSLNSGHELLWY